MPWRWPFSSRKQLTDEQILDMLGTGRPTATGIRVSPETALQVPAVAAAVRTIAEAAASFDVKVVEIGAGGAETDRPDHPAATLLRGEANGWTSGFELVRSLMVDVLTRDAGALAWVNWIRAEPTEIIRYNPGVIAAEFAADGSGEPSYRINGRPVPAQQIVHLRGPFEKSPVTLAREAIGAAVAMERHAARLFGNGARPSGVLRTTKPVGEKGVASMIAAWRAAHEGPENSGRTAVLYDGAEWQQLQLSSVDAQFQELRLFQLQEIARAFNIPVTMIGDLTRATWSNSAEMQRLFLMLCLEPWLKALESALRRALFLRDERRRLAVRIDRDDFSKVNLSVLAAAINSLVASRVLNPNEGRSWLGLPQGPAALDEFANPNTGASQPGRPAPAGNPPAPAEEDEADA